MTLENNGVSENFGDNAWLVDELYKSYQKDRNSVDARWLHYFRNFDESPPSPADAAAPSQSSPPDKRFTTQASGTAAHHTATITSETHPPISTSKTGTTTMTTASIRAISTADPKAPVPPMAKDGAGQNSKPAQLPKTYKRSSPSAEDINTTLRGPAKAIAKNMTRSLEVPTATSVRAIPAKLMIDNRTTINNHLKQAQGGKLSFTHLIAYAMIQAIKEVPSQNVCYAEVDGKPTAVTPAHINLGIAIDLPRSDGTRLLVVPNIKKAETLGFKEFLDAYNDLVKRGREGRLKAEDYAGTTVSITNPGGIGTNHSMPRLSEGQACILGVGAMEYPAPFQGSSEKIISRNAISKIVTLTSTYDHRVIQGAGSGEFLRYIHQLLLGEHRFYDHIFENLRIPHEPIRWAQDNQVNPEIQINKVAHIQQLIDAFRSRGHLTADTNPLEYVMRHHPDLDVENHELTLWDLDREWPTGGFGGKDILKLRDILAILRDAYVRTTGFEYMHIQDPEQRQWFQDKLEHPYRKPTREKQLHIIDRLNAAEAFETFIQTKFVGQKRFSLEGGESLIPLLDEVLSNASARGLKEVTIGMAHRGRLNVLTNIAGKSYAQVFNEFEGNIMPGSVQGSGDVKYHMGADGVFTSAAGHQTKVYLAANPSHLEAVDPVVEGITRAKMDQLAMGAVEYPVLPILIHGDAAMAGQGVIAETLNLSQLRGYRTGGTIHIVVNNQIGFTTAPSSSRSSTYSTDVALMVQAPVFHVNGDDPEAVVRVAKLAFEYRQKFHKDVVVDLVCYRRRGHNEGDDPSMTQPLMYSLIGAKRSTRRLYTEQLIGRGDVTQEEAEALVKNFQDRLEEAFAETHEAQTASPPKIDAPAKHPGFSNISLEVASKPTKISAELLRRVGEVHTEIPADFHVHAKIKQLLKRRDTMSTQGGIDWGFGELAAFGSLVAEGVPVRVSGQDSRRGTFAHRHAVIHDAQNGREWTPLTRMSDGQATFAIYDSSLSEYAALGFEYGYSVERPEALVIWEAQFGDFANGAQTIMDEFISSAEQKWGQESSVVLLLPHGYEGQGPDHSSARIERVLQLCAENNMVVAHPSTPANYFHILRRQAFERPRKPLIVFTPKQLLRLKAAASNVEDFTSGSFMPVIADSMPVDAVTRVVLVSGRLYYSLLAEREKNDDKTTALIRMERLYALPAEEIKAELRKYRPGVEVVWAQDEPENQGAWSYIDQHFENLVRTPISVISRPASAATATGSAKRHAQEEKKLILQIFAR